jgi:hypothetical protein
VGRVWLDRTRLNVLCISRLLNLVGSTFLLWKKDTPSDHYYLSLVCMYLDTKMCLDTSTLAIGNNGRREYHNIATQMAENDVGYLIIVQCISILHSIIN